MKKQVTKVKERLKKPRGFTLMEMLIVVAIIAILVAVSIPVFTSQLDKARKATDMANQRAAKAVASMMLLTKDEAINDVFFVYNADEGKLQVASTTVKPYGKCSDHKDMYLAVTIMADLPDPIDIYWKNSSGKADPPIDK